MLFSIFFVTFHQKNKIKKQNKNIPQAGPLVILQLIFITTANAKTNILDIICVLVCLFVIVTKLNNISIPWYDMYPYSRTITLLVLSIDFVGLVSTVSWISYLNMGNDNDNKTYFSKIYFMDNLFLYYNINLYQIYGNNYTVYCYLQSLKYAMYSLMYYFGTLLIIPLTATFANSLRKYRPWQGIGLFVQIVTMHFVFGRILLYLHVLH